MLPTSRRAFTLSALPKLLNAPYIRSQRHSRLPHHRRPRLFFTMTLQDHRAKHALPRHPPTFRHLPRRTRAGNAVPSRPEASHADGVSRAYAGGRWHDTRSEGTDRGGGHACERGAYCGTAESGEEADVLVCCGWVEGRVSVTGMSGHDSLYRERGSLKSLGL